MVSSPATFSSTAVILSSNWPLRNRPEFPLCWASNKATYSASNSLTRFAGTSRRRPFCSTINNGNLFFYCDRSILSLLQNFNVTCSFVQSSFSRCVKVGTEFWERFQLTVLRLIKFQCSGNFLHRLDLRVTTNTGYRNTYVDRRRTPALNRLVSRKIVRLWWRSR